VLGVVDRVWDEEFRVEGGALRVEEGQGYGFGVEN